MLVTCVVGTRPNLVKIAPILRAFESERGRLLARFGEFRTRLVHTGQHFDHRMSDVFFEELGIPEPDVNLGVHRDGNAIMVASTMKAFENDLAAFPPDLVMVVGDVNATSACAQTAAYRRIPVAHVEAGLRSFDRSMPEELNRIVTDHLSCLHFATCDEAVENLLREGIGRDSIKLVGNVMVDTLMRTHRRLAEIKDQLSIPRGDYALATLHRPSNVDDAAVLERLLGVLARASGKTPVILPAHPRTRERISAFGLEKLVRRINPEKLEAAVPDSVVWITEPLGYLHFHRLLADSAFVITDSGGLQEETTCLRIPCLTVRENTERPVTTEQGSNQIVGSDPDKIDAAIDDILSGRYVPSDPPSLWDGKAAGRIVDELIALPDDWFTSRY